MKSIKILNSLFILLMMMAASFTSASSVQAGESQIPLTAGGDLVWAKSMGGTMNDSPGEIAIDSNGNIYTTGYFRSTADFDPEAGSTNLVSNGLTDIYIAKYHSDGRLNWAKGIGSTGNDFERKMLLDNNNNIYITGNFTGTIDFDPGANVFNITSSGESDIFLLKLDSNGNFIWVKSMGGTSYDTGEDIALDASGNIYLLTSFSETADLDPSEGSIDLISNGYGDIALLKLNSSGSLIWSKSFGGTGDDYGNAFFLDESGNVYITGNFDGTVDFDPDIAIMNLTGDFYDIFISVIDENGDFLWAAKLGGNGIQDGVDIALDIANNIYVSGSFQNTVDFDPNNSSTYEITSEGEGDAYVLKLSNSGNFIWVKTMGSSGDDWVNEIKIDENQVIYISGSFKDTVDFDPTNTILNLTSNGLNDIFTAIFDSSGNLVMVKNMGGTLNDYPYGLALDSEKNIFTTGLFSGTADFNPGAGTTNLTSVGGTDIFISKLEGDASTSIFSITRTSTSPTSATSVDFTVTFSESVQNVDVNNFSLTTTGVTGASITGVTPISASVYTISVNTGSGNGTIRLDVPDTASIKDLSNNDLSGLPFTSGEVYTIEKSTPLPTGWVGSVSVTSDKSLVSVGRPHIGSEVASYDGFASGSTNAFVPMLFKDAFGGDYDAALYIQNVSGSSASVTLEFYDTSGSLNCTKSDSIAALASKGYWLPSVSCTSGSLPSGWVGGVKVSSDQPIVAVGRPHIGSEVMTYNGFSSGSTSAFIPMLFKDAFGGSYDSAFYIQNVGTSSASVTIQYFDNSGSLNCTKSDSIASFASKGYWLPSATCDSGSLPTGWVGGVKVSSDQPIVTVGRPHIGSQITTYDGFSAGSSASFVPMLFKGAFGGSYDSAFYLQNTGASSASVTIEYYDNSGSLNCTKSDAIAPLASKGYWLPSATCDTGSLPAGWVGGVKVSSDQPVVAVGRPHIGSQITTYNGFPSGAVSAFLPMLFKDAFGGEYDSAFYLQNTEASEASVTIQFFDNTGTLTCSRTDTIQPRATLGFWVPSATCFP